MSNLLVAALGVTAAGVACGVPAGQVKQPSQQQLTRGVEKFLERQGDLCVGKFSWPRDVTEQDRRVGSGDAVQLPVLERLGLVQSVEVPAVGSDAGTPAGASTAAGAGTVRAVTAAGAGTVAGVGTVAGAGAAEAGKAAAGSESAGGASVQRYTLTARGLQYYLHKKRIALEAKEQPVEHNGDFCVAHLSLDKVVKWTPPTSVEGRMQTEVAYTYHIKPAEWMSDPEARKVFPVVDRIISGEGKMQMDTTLQFQRGKWVPALPEM